MVTLFSINELHILNRWKTRVELSEQLFWVLVKMEYVNCGQKMFFKKIFFFWVWCW